MNFEKLISKYLDGELNNAEDKELRALLKEEPEARESFDTAVFLHMALKDDAESISPPDNLVRDTEDVILMKIMSQTPLIQEQPARSFLFKKPIMSVAVSLLLLFAVVNIDDSLHNNGNYALNNAITSIYSQMASDYQGSQKYSTEIQTNFNTLTEIQTDFNTSTVSADFNTSTVSTVNSMSSERPAVRSSQNGGATVSSEFSENYQTLALAEDNHSEVLNSRNNSVRNFENNSVPNSVHNSVPNSGSVDLSASDATGYADNADPADRNADIEQSDPGTPAFSEPQPTDMLANTDMLTNIVISQHNNGSGSGSLVPQQLQNTINNPFRMINIVNPADYYRNSSDIHLNSFMGTDIYHNGISTKSKTLITNFSQSLGYSVDETQQIGLEIGYIELNYNDNISIQVPLGGEEIAGKTEVLRNDHSESGYVYYPFTVEQAKQVIWGAAFYETDIWDAHDLNVRGRLGFGGTTDGPLGFGRLYLQYELFSGFALTLGTEGKMFFAKVNTQGDNEVKTISSASLIYGFRFIF